VGRQDQDVGLGQQAPDRRLVEPAWEGDAFGQAMGLGLASVGPAVPVPRQGGVPTEPCDALGSERGQQLGTPLRFSQPSEEDNAQGSVDGGAPGRFGGAGTPLQTTSILSGRTPICSAK